MFEFIFTKNTMFIWLFCTSAYGMHTSISDGISFPESSYIAPVVQQNQTIAVHFDLPMEIKGKIVKFLPVQDAVSLKASREPSTVCFFLSEQSHVSKADAPDKSD
jgi:hypothetical protein